jgi:dephospho-CoA kinase
MLRVGLTGGIASGKSHVRRRLEASGFPTLDLDEVAHRLTAPGGAAYADVVAAFGPRILTRAEAADGTIDRRVLGALVFADPQARARLNALIHPRVREEEERAAAALAATPGAVLVTDAALLVEVGVHLRFDRMVVVHCPPEEQERRLRLRDGLDEAAARARLEAQMGADEKRRFAHYPIDTQGPLELTDRQVDALVVELRGLAPRPWRPLPLPPERALGSLVAGPARAAGGIEITALLSVLVRSSGLEMERLREPLAPGSSGPWYRAGRRDVATAPAAAAMAPLVLWSLARRGPDPPWLAVAAASVARLTHSAPEALAGAVLFALALEDVARGGGRHGLAARLPEWADAAARWGGGAPEPAVLEAVRSAAAGQGPEGTLAGALLGMAQGVPEAAAPPELRELVRALASRSA